MDELDKICIHWSVTGYTPTQDCFDHYHYIIDDKGYVHAGKRGPESNLAHSVQAGTYQAHCGGGNTNCIGVSMASMLGYEGRHHVGQYPITERQFEGCCEYIAKLCLKYDIKIDNEHIFTHRKFGLLHPHTSSAGKIDIEFLPHKPELKPDEIDDYFISKIKWYYDKIK
jgi:N-acetylmuramoyl-L-alanine amidase